MDPDRASLLEQMLRPDGHVIARADSLEAIGCSAPDLILVDSDGCRLVRALKAAGAQLPVIMLAASVAQSAMLAGLDAGADAVLTLAPNPDQAALRLTVRNLLRLTSAMQRKTEGLIEGEIVKLEADTDAMTIRLARAREQERISLARELHDELGQGLALLKIDLHHLRAFVQGIDGLKAWQDADAEVVMLTARVRAIALSLRPPALDGIGLEAALRQLLERQFGHGAAHCIFDYAGLPARLAPGLDIALYRIVQESVANIVRHAGATRVAVEINGGASGDELELIIRDDGCGFDASILHGGSGLPGIRERVQLLGGLFFLESAPQRGTRIVVQLQLAPESTP
jgi:signal transduction histidine kinase